MTIRLKSRSADVVAYRLPVVELPADWLATAAVAGLCEWEHPSFGHLKVTADDSTDPALMLEELLLTVGGEEIALRFQRPVLTPFLRRAGILGDREALQADPNLAALVLEHVLTPALFAAEADLGLPVRLVGVRPARQQSRSIPPTLRLKAVCTLWMGLVRIEVGTTSPAGAALVRKVMADLSPAPAAPPLDLLAQVRVDLPAIKIPLSDLKALSIGDAVQMEERWPGLSGLTLSVAGRRVGPVVWRDTKLVLGASHPKLPTAEGDQTMTEMLPDEAFTVDDVPVTLVLELDRIDVPFAALSGLKPGAVIPCDRPLPESVRVLVNGRHFATAGLVQIDGRLGLRIISLANRAG